MKTLLQFIVWLAVASLLMGSVTRADRPNVLVIIADDCTHLDLPVYGGENAKTPNIDQLASEGLVFNKAYLAEAMCQPCRAELYTGLYPMSNGCNWNHSASLPQTKSLPHYLGESDYRVGLAGKVHVKPDKVFPFEKVGGFEPSCVRDPTRTHDLTDAESFITRDDNPFCLVIALVDPHVPWVMGDASAYPPRKIKLPPNIADNKVTREAFSRYLAEITYMDGQVGEILDMLKRTGHQDDTLVLFTSEQGAQFPGCKWTNWDTGLHTALIARWPGKVAPATRTDALVQYADIVPTLLEVAGDEKDRDLDGSSFKKVLTGESTSHREFVYGTHNNVPEGPPYPIRTISDGTYRYIRNLSPENLYIEKHVMGINDKAHVARYYWQTWVWDSTTNAKTNELVHRYMRRPAEQFYHTQSDPYEMVNLADSESSAQKMSLLSKELDRWMQEQGDPGAAQDTTESLQAAKKGNHRFGVRATRQPAAP